jgi:REP element-mobilizing transposase RayT
MARPLRMEGRGWWYHITSRGNGRARIFLDDRDRTHFLELLAELSTRFRWRLHAYTLMTNHYHLEVETREANLSRGMQWLQVSYSVWFNRRHDRVGHVFQGRFKAVIVEAEEWGVRLSHYIHLNPVRVARLGLGKDDRARERAGAGRKAGEEVVGRRLEVLRQYRWSSYRAHAELEKGPGWLEGGWLLERMGRGSEKKRRRRYRREAETFVGGEPQESPWESLVGGMLLGGQAWVEEMKGKAAGDRKEQPPVRELGVRPQWRWVVEAVEAEKGEGWNAFRDRYGDWGRDVAMVLGRRECGMKLRELGELCGGLDYRSVGTAVAKMGRVLERSKEARTRYERIRGRLWR